jgi:hypothetical protein
VVCRFHASPRVCLCRSATGKKMKAHGIHGAGRCVTGLPRCHRFQAPPPLPSPSLPSLPGGRKKDVSGQTFIAATRHVRFVALRCAASWRHSVTPRVELLVLSPRAACLVVSCCWLLGGGTQRGTQQGLSMWHSTLHWLRHEQVFGPSMLMSGEAALRLRSPSLSNTP